MILQYDTQAPKKSANLRVNGELLLKAREMNINLSAILEEAIAEQLRLQLREKKRQLWRKQNAKAIQAYNRFVEEQGVFSDGLRSF